MGIIVSNGIWKVVSHKEQECVLPDEMLHYWVPSPPLEDWFGNAALSDSWWISTEDENMSKAFESPHSISCNGCLFDAQMEDESRVQWIMQDLFERKRPKFFHNFPTSGIIRTDFSCGPAFTVGRNLEVQLFQVRGPTFTGNPSGKQQKLKEISQDRLTSNLVGGCTHPKLRPSLELDPDLPLTLYLTLCRDKFLLFPDTLWKFSPLFSRPQRFLGNIQFICSFAPRFIRSTHNSGFATPFFFQKSNSYQLRCGISTFINFISKSTKWATHSPVSLLNSFPPQRHNRFFWAYSLSFNKYR